MGKWAKYGLGVLCALLTIAVVAPTGASGTIIATTGRVTQIAPPPSVELDKLQSKTDAFVFAERSTTLGTAVGVDIVDPGTYTLRSQLVNATIASGTRVDSHFIDSDPGGSGFTALRTGSVTFNADVLGIVVSRPKLATSDALLGAPSTRYADFYQREPELGAAGADSVTLSADRRTVSVVLNTPNVTDQLRIITGHVTKLNTTIVGTPDPVTLGNNVKYTYTVKNAGDSTEPSVAVTANLPAGSSLVDAPASCSGGGPVQCSLGDLAPGASASVDLVVESPAAMPPGNAMTTTGTATPGTNPTGSLVTGLVVPNPTSTSGFVLPGDSIGTGGSTPATLTLPGTGNGAPVVLTQGPGNFCLGPCKGPATEVSEFPGYDDPNHPIRLVLEYGFATDLPGAAVAFATDDIFKYDGVNPPAIVPDCNDDPSWTPQQKADAAARRAQRLGTQSGIASPSPCINSRAIVAVGGGYQVAYEVLYLSGDPRFAR
jgi:uncharacterized repeat protein (TIGR01451 family)